MTFDLCVYLTVCDLHSHLHDRVVRRDEDREQVQVSGGEDECKQHLRLPRDACREKERTKS